MIDLLAVYICPKHGEILEDEIEILESIDFENDEVYRIPTHVKDCNHEVTRKVVEIDGKKVPCFQSVDHERWLWATGFYDDLLKEEY